MVKRYKIQSHLRFSIFLILIMMVLFLLLSPFFNVNQVKSLSANRGYSSVMIKNGDTLWNLAKVHGPNNIDTRKVVYEICTINDISSNEIIKPGQSILIPK